jgi:dolichol-phosphate mannosyltransferase
MPPVRLFGDAALSFLTKLSSGDWSIFDPTNGFIAWDSRILDAIPMEKLASRYFFESDMLFRIGLLRAKVLDIPMAATYGSEVSGLNPGKKLLPFLLSSLRNFFKRIVYNYFLRDFNVGSIEITFGSALCARRFPCLPEFSCWLASSITTCSRPRGSRLRTRCPTAISSSNEKFIASPGLRFHDAARANPNPMEVFRDSDHWIVSATAR